ncbi:MAG: hypothetical protein QXM96_00220 [Candidatus Woesearchaeota archaeon]
MLFSTTGAFLYYQYCKLMDYVLNFSRIKINKITKDFIDFDLFLFITNKSNIKYSIVEQEYELFLNNVYLTKMVNYSENVIYPNSKSEIGINIKLNFKDFLEKGKMSLSDILTNKNASLLIKMNLIIKVYFIKFKLPYEYNIDLLTLLNKK